MSTSAPIPAVDISVRTDPGRDPDKQVNEDSSVKKETALGLLAVVCDGMGGHAGGKEASELAIQTIVEIVEAAPAVTPPGVALKRAIEEANARIWTMPTAEAGYRPGSTVVGVLIHEGGAEVAHVGDSRLYLVHAGAISQVTRDHSMVQELVDRNLIRAEDAAKHPDANKILRALGIGKDVEVDLRSDPIPYVAGDVLILCSDGLSDLVEPAEILEIAGSQPPAQAAGQLVDLANARGGHDNITAMVIRMKASAVVSKTNERAGRGVAKTIPLTVHAVAPTEPGGPTGTLVSSPARSAPGPVEHGSANLPAHGRGAGHVAPMQLPPVPESNPNIGILPAPPPSSHRGRNRTPILVLGIMLAVVAVGLLGAILIVANRPRHHAVPLVTDDRRPTKLDAGDDDDAGPEPTVTAAPPLTPEPSQRWRRDGGVSDPCGALQRARDRDASAQLIGKLEEKCRTHGAP